MLVAIIDLKHTTTNKFDDHPVASSIDNHVVLTKLLTKAYTCSNSEKPKISYISQRLNVQAVVNKIFVTYM